MEELKKLQTSCHPHRHNVKRSNNNNNGAISKCDTMGLAIRRLSLSLPPCPVHIKMEQEFKKSVIDNDDDDDGKDRESGRPFIVSY